MPIPTVCLAASIALCPPADGSIDTSAPGLQRDVDVLERCLKALHPGLYRYRTPRQLDEDLRQLRRELNRDQPLASAYLRLSEFLAKVRCGHTYANFFNQPEAVAKDLFDKPDKVPFTFRWLRNTMVVTRDASAEGAFPRGSEILAIDGVSTRSILAKLLRVARADGGNDAKRAADLEVLGNAKYEAFDVFYPLYYPSSSRAYRFTVKKPGAVRAEVVTARMVSASARMVEDSEIPARPESPVWTLTYPKSDVAYLKMPTWAMYNRKWQWRSFLDASFDELSAKSTPNLIIDLRGNEGGDSVGDFILPRLVRQAVASENYQRYTRYRSVPQDLRANLSTWDSSFFDWGKAAQPALDGFYKLTRFDDLKGSVVSPSSKPYRGSVYVLVGPENSSATFEFAYQVQRLKLGTLVGRPTGGSLRGINGGAFFFLSLPNSRIEVDLPLIAQLSPDKRADSGVTPDVAVEATATDIANGIDAELEAVFRLIRKQ